MAKLKFNNLPAVLQQKHGYDVEKGAAYETEQTKGQAMVVAKMWADYNVATNKIAIRLAKEEAEAQVEAEKQRIKKEKEVMRAYIAWEKAEEEKRRKEEMYESSRRATENTLRDLGY